MPALKNSFNKQEKLKSRKQINQLFHQGNSLFVHPVKVSWLMVPAQEKPVLAGVSVSKRHFKKAVDRNRIKRLLRECYRLNKHELVELAAKRGIYFSVFFIYVDKTLPTFYNLEETMKRCLKRLAVKVNQHEKLL
jgi:ribonuclease P protein component